MGTPGSGEGSGRREVASITPGMRPPSSRPGRAWRRAWVPGALLLLLGGLAEAQARDALLRAHTWARTRGGGESAYCLGCHDGSVAPGLAARMQMDVIALRASGSSGSVGDGGHLVGVDYARAQRARPLDLTDPAVLPPSIRLVHGRVECVTCHDPTSPAPRKLALEVRTGALCLACHRL